MLHHPTLGSLVRSADRGCEFCILLLSVLSTFHKKPEDGKRVFLAVHQMDRRPSPFEWAEGKLTVRDRSTAFLHVPDDAWGYIRASCGEVRGIIPLHEFDGESIIGFENLVEY